MGMRSSRHLQNCWERHCSLTRVILVFLGDGYAPREWPVPSTDPVPQQ